MDPQLPPEYSEELPLDPVSREQYYNAARQAVAALRWPVAAADGHTIICHTRGINNLLGEQVTIIVGENNAVFASRAANEYYWTDNQNSNNARLFREAWRA